MRLSYKTYPIWEYIENPRKIIPNDIHGRTMEIDEAVAEYFRNKGGKDPAGAFMDHLVGMSQVAQQVKERFYISEAFSKAMLKALPRLEKENYQNVEPKAAAGVLIVNNGVTLYLCNPGDSPLKLAVYGFTRTAHTCFAILTKWGHIGGSYKTINPQTGILEERPDLMAQWIHNVLLTLYFIKEVDIETKVMKPNEKYRTTGRYAEKHFNESKTDITVVDCTWFTELIRVGETKVGWHLRKQPYGPRTDPKYRFIIIEGYTKGPYVRRAKKEIYDEKHKDEAAE